MEKTINKKIDMYVGNIPNIILSCHILYNICEVHGDMFNEE